MSTSYQTPGVYFEWVDSSRRGITAIPTDIAAFLGLAERGPLHEPRRVHSWQQFQSLYGRFIPGGYLAYAVKAFFENGGRRCEVIRIADADTAVAAAAPLTGEDGAPTLAIRASSPGVWGNALQVRLGRGQATATRSSGPQEPAGGSLRVLSVVGFTPGTLVRLYQQDAGGADVRQHLVVDRVDALQQRLLWRGLLRLAPSVPGEPVFDLTRPIELETRSFSLSVYEQHKLRAIYPDLAIVPDHARYAPAVINPDPDDPASRSAPLPLIQVVDLHAGLLPPGGDWSAWLPDVAAETAVFTQGRLTLSGGTDGLAALAPHDFTGDPGSTQRSGLRTLELIDDVSLVAIPDILIRPVRFPTYLTPPPPVVDPCLPCSPPPPPPPAAFTPPEQPPTFSEAQILQVQQALVLHCEQMGDRVALLDPPPPARGLFDPGELLRWRQQFDSSYAACYVPWVLVVDPLRLAGQVVRAVPPSGHVAGIAARTDLTIGVHKAPANEPLSWAQGLTLDISAELQGALNPAHVNCLRHFPGRGFRVYGARTLSSDPAWRFLNVRRLINMIKKALFLSLQWAVFEPNNVFTRQLILLAVSSFLSALWQRGALVGSAPEEAFFVRCDEVNNLQADVDNGQLHVDIGVAPVQPAEFIRFLIGRTEDELELTEQVGLQI